MAKFARYLKVFISEENKSQMIRLLNISLMLCWVVLIASCSAGKSKNDFRKDSHGRTVPVASYVGVAVDETFRPVLEILFNDFSDRNPEAFIDPQYMPEDEAIRMLLNDSIRSVVATRVLKDNEKAYLRSKYNLVPTEKIVAFDAIALITNNSNPDTLISKQELQDIMCGRITDWSELQHSNGQKGEIEIVFDNNGSSTVRYMQDSICLGAKPKGKLRAAKTYDELINYVSHKKNSIGVLGVDWVGNHKDTTRLSFLSTVKIMSVSAKKSSDAIDYCQPFQFYIASGSYPLTRGVYIITTDPRTRSMEKNFMYYLTDEPNHNNMGQMMILKFSQLLPYMTVQSHNVVIKRY